MNGYSSGSVTKEWNLQALSLAAFIKFYISLKFSILQF